MTRPLKFTPPPGACDSHIHVYGDPAQFPPLPVQGREMEPHFLDGYIGVRGLRFGIELARGMRPPHLEIVAARIAPLGWHIQYRSTEQDLPELAERLSALPVDLVVDHIGSIPPELGTGHPAFVALLRMLETGRCWVKLSAVCQLSKMGAPDYSDYRTFVRALVAAAPARVLCGTNWPHPKAGFMRMTRICWKPYSTGSTMRQRVIRCSSITRRDCMILIRLRRCNR